MSPNQPRLPHAPGMDPAKALVLKPVAAGLVSSVLLSVALRAATDWPEGSIQAAALAVSVACALAQLGVEIRTLIRRRG